jgi:MFS family permease
VGPILALFLVSVFSVRTAILLSVIPGLMAAAAILFAVRHLPRLAKREHARIRIRFREVLQGRLRSLIVGISAFEIGNVAATLLILRATELLAPDRTLKTATEIALVLYLTYNVFATVASFFAGRRIDRAGARIVLLVGVTCFAVAYGLFAFTTSSVGILGLAFVAAGIGIGFVETAEHAAVAAAAPEDARGSAFGVLAAVQSFGNFAASTTAGVLWTVVSPGAAFCYLAAWMLVAMVLLLRSGRNTLTSP